MFYPTRKSIPAPKFSGDFFWEVPLLIHQKIVFELYYFGDVAFSYLVMVLYQLTLPPKSEELLFGSITLSLPQMFFGKLIW